jgi:hypothetical protein
MNITKQIRGYGVWFAAAMILAACGSQQEPAGHAVDNVTTAIGTVGPQLQKYMPDQYTVLQARVTSLKAAFDKGDYGQVLSDAPTLMNDIQGLAAVATAKKSQRVRNLAEQWPRLTASIPDAIAAVQARIDVLSKNKKDAAKVDLPAAQASMAQVTTLWPKAQEAFTAGDAETATDTARAVQGKIDAAAASLKFTLPRPMPASAAAH